MTPALPPLVVHLFGAVRVARSGETRAVPLSHNVQGLLAFLMLHRDRLHHRETLATLFWGEQDEGSARGCLSTTLWRLRKALEPPGTPRGTYLVVEPGGEVGFNGECGCWLDVAIVEDALRHLERDRPAERDLGAMEQALSQYTSDLLDGFYDEWAVRERERLRYRYLEGLTRLLQWYRDSGDTEQAVQVGRRILACDGLREGVHREVIRCHIALGQRAQALLQYESCRQTLARELGVEPMPETSASILDTPPVRAHAVESTASAASEPSLIATLQATARALDATRAQLWRTLQEAQRTHGSAR